MNKAILVIDMPKECLDCCFHNYHFCEISGNNIEKNLYSLQEYGKPKECPLKELPKRKYYGEEEFNGWVKGWNDCLKEIIKE